MVFCTYCGNSFTRDEHLERHILTHTNVKPFKCYTCHMSFARRDLLQRHYTVHGRKQPQQDVPAANGMLPKTAGRTPIACTNCAKTKTKCDKKFPCSRCTSRNLVCTIRPTRRSTKNAERLGLITAETIAQSMANGTLPPDQTVAAEQVALPMDVSYTNPTIPADPHTPHRHGSTSSSCCGSSSPSSVGHSSVSPDSFHRPSLDSVTSSATPPEYHVSPVTPVHHGNSLDAHLGGYDDSMASKLMSEESNPQFMLDWQQFQFPGNFDPSLQNDMFMQQDMGLDMSFSQFGPALDPSYITMDLAETSMPSYMMTPVETPGLLQRSYSDAEIADLTEQHRLASPTTNQTIESLNNLAIGGQVPQVTTELTSQDHWNVFRCIPNVKPTTSPSTARQNLDALERTLKKHDVWNAWRPDLDSSVDRHESLAVMQLHHSTRDKLLAITQGLLHRAKELHRVDSAESTSSSPSSFVLLPPTNVLEYLLHSYSSTFEAYLPVTDRGSLDANELIHCHHDQASSLLVLLMLAQGAVNTSSADAKALVPGLVETCRVSLSDLVDRDAQMATKQHVLHAALLLTNLAAWGGDKAQMDAAMSQRGIYTAVLRNARMLDDHSATSFINEQSTVDQTWNVWTQQEVQSRLVYSWTMLDQELALFHDTAPLLSVTELGISLPQSDLLWKARSAGEWSASLSKVLGSSPASNLQPLSLRDLFRHFLDDDMQSVEYPLTALHLRLLLQPLQSMVCHSAQLLGCFSDAPSSRSKSKSAPTASSTRARLTEAQALLQRWHSLAESHLQTHPLCPTMQSSLTLYHVISLNAVSDLPRIEALARREQLDGTYATLTRVQKRCVADSRPALFHAGQVLRLARAFPRSRRPAWWAAAVYRAAMVMWCDALVAKEDAVRGAPVAIDNLGPDHPGLTRWLRKADGTPCLTARDGASVPVDNGVAVLALCGDVLGDHGGAPLQAGVAARLDRLMRS